MIVGPRPWLRRLGRWQKSARPELLEAQRSQGRVSLWATDICGEATSRPRAIRAIAGRRSLRELSRSLLRRVFKIELQHLKDVPQHKGVHTSSFDGL